MNEIAIAAVTAAVPMAVESFLALLTTKVPSNCCVKCLPPPAKPQVATCKVEMHSDRPEMLVAVLRSGSDLSKKRALRIIAIVSMRSPCMQKRYAKAGAIEPLVALLRTGSHKTWSAVALACLFVHNRENREEFMKISGGLEILRDMSLSGSARQRESAAVALKLLRTGRARDANVTTHF